MATASQLRAARALIAKSLDEVAQATGMDKTALESAEASRGAVEQRVEQRLQRYFEAQGVIFVAAGQHDASGDGVRLQPQPRDEGLRPQQLNATNDD